MGPIGTLPTFLHFKCGPPLQLDPAGQFLPGLLAELWVKADQFSHGDQ